MYVQPIDLRDSDSRKKNWLQLFSGVILRSKDLGKYVSNSLVDQ